MPAFTVTDRTEAAKVMFPGDTAAQLQYCLKNSIPDTMDFLDYLRATSRYDYTAFPPEVPGILVRSAKGRADEIWEGRPNWTNPRTEPGTLVHRLDTNAAYLAATNTHLPIGTLEHSIDGVFDRKRSGLYLIDPPYWQHHHLPNPIGNREEPGPVWIARPTLQLLFDCSTERYGQLCDAPVIHESWTSGSTDALLRKWRETLRDARAHAILQRDEVALAYVKDMYAKFVSTCGDSSANRRIRRQDWVHIIRAQAFANLWRKSLKANSGGLQVHRVWGTDELHVVGGWEAVFTEGRGLNEMKIKAENDDHGSYTVMARGVA